ncbi:hypothetical protein EDB87DRAFT_1580489 [Lactarius vividus]|nr:hypothetical protein EDB87DRAFT_1580489 [Lactarius vividus]
MAQIGGLPHRLDAVYERAFPSYRAAPAPICPPKIRPTNGPQPSHVTSGLLTTEDAEASVATAADVYILLGSIDESDGPFLLPDRTQPTPITQGATRRLHSVALQEELAAQLAQMAAQLGRTRRCCPAEKVGAILDVMKQEHVRLRDRRGKALGTTCLTISSVVIAIASLVIFFVILFT